jgi:hypothetical protein
MDTLLGEGTLLIPLSIDDMNVGITCREESIERICSHHFCSLGLQRVMGIGMWQMANEEDPTVEWQAQPFRNESR